MHGFNEGGGDCQALWRQNCTSLVRFLVRNLYFESICDKELLQLEEEMKLIQKYLLREHVLMLLYCLGAMAMILVIYDLFDHLSAILSQKPTLIALLMYYVFLLAPSLEILSPAALLLATLYTIWQFSRRNELIAMRAGGVGVYRLMVPFLAVGLAMSLFTTMVKETVAPRASQWMAEFSSKGKGEEGRVYFNLPHYSGDGRRQWMVGKLDLNEMQTLHDVQVTCEREDGSRMLRINSPQASWLDGQWWFSDPEFMHYDTKDNPTQGDQPVATPGCDLVQLSFLDERPSDFVNELISWDFLSTRAILRYFKRHPQLSKRDRAQKLLLLHQRVALPWASLVVTLFAIPAGMKGGRKSPVVGILATIGCFFGYWSLFQIGTFLGMRQLVWPWLGGWMANAVFLVTGVVMVLRVE